MKAFKYKFCKDIQSKRNDPRYRNIYLNTLTDCSGISGIIAEFESNNC